MKPLPYLKGLFLRAYGCALPGSCAAKPPDRLDGRFAARAGVVTAVLAVALAGLFPGGSAAQAATPGEVARDFALAQVGDPYRYGGSGPNSWDCSGLAQASWGAAGKAIPRTSRAQHAALPHVPLDALQPGDLLFAYRPVGHVGLYVGDGQWVHAPNSGGAVEVVPIPWHVVVGAARP